MTFLKASISRCLYFYDLIYAIPADAGDALVPASARLCIRAIIKLSEANVYFIFVRRMCCCAWHVVLQRKNGLFKKAYELGVLCSVDVAVIIFGVFETVLCSAVFLLLTPSFDAPFYFYHLSFHQNVNLAPLRHPVPRLVLLLARRSRPTRR